MDPLQLIYGITGAHCKYPKKADFTTHKGAYGNYYAINVLYDETKCMAIQEKILGL